MATSDYLISPNMQDPLQEIVSDPVTSMVGKVSKVDGEKVEAVARGLAAMREVTDKTGFALLPKLHGGGGLVIGAERLRCMLLQEESDGGVETVVLIWSTKEALVDEGAACFSRRQKKLDANVVEKKFVQGREMKALMCTPYGYAPSGGLIFVHAKKTTPTEKPWSKELAQYADYADQFMQAVWMPKEDVLEEECAGEGHFVLFGLLDAGPIAKDVMRAFLEKGLEASLLPEVKKLVYITPADGKQHSNARMKADFAPIRSGEGMWKAWECPVSLKKLYSKAEISIILLPKETPLFLVGLHLETKKVYIAYNVHLWAYHGFIERETFLTWKQKMDADADEAAKQKEEAAEEQQQREKTQREKQQREKQQQEAEREQQRQKTQRDKEHREKAALSREKPKRLPLAPPAAAALAAAAGGELDTKEKNAEAHKATPRRINLLHELQQSLRPSLKPDTAQEATPTEQKMILQRIGKQSEILEGKCVDEVEILPAAISILKDLARCVQIGFANGWKKGIPRITTAIEALCTNKILHGKNLEGWKAVFPDAYPEDAEDEEDFGVAEEAGEEEGEVELPQLPPVKRLGEPRPIAPGAHPPAENARTTRGAAPHVAFAGAKRKVNDEATGPPSPAPNVVVPPGYELKESKQVPGQWYLRNIATKTSTWVVVEKE